MKLTGTARFVARRLVVLAIGLVMLAGNPAAGQSSDKGAESAEAQVIVLYVRQSKTVDAPWPATRVSVTDPKVADVQMLTPRKVLLQGKSVGSTDLIMWGKDERVWRARIDVDVDLRRMKAELKKLFPQSSLAVTQAQDVVVVTGLLRRAEHADQLRKFMDATKLEYVDMTSVAGIQQVLLQVRIAEVSRVALRLLGINAFTTHGDFFTGSTVGSSTGGAINPISIGVPSGADATTSNIPFQFNSAVNVSSSVTVFGGIPEIGLQLFIQALAENQYLRILAEPNIVALSGEEASFLAGGEFPIPIVQGSSAGGGTSITIEYREFGVRLRFRPTILGDAGIRLYVAPEVSELSTVGAVEIEGFSVPSVLTRRAETTLELKSGQTFAMAGLINRSVNARVSRVPGLGDLPILGALFRSVRYVNEETDLVVIVTASLVEPISPAGPLPLPGVMHTPPNDWQLYALGQIEGQAPAKLSASQTAWLKKQGLDQLKGPGAWATYGQEAARSTSVAEAPSAPSPQIGSGGSEKLPAGPGRLPETQPASPED